MKKHRSSCNNSNPSNPASESHHQRTSVEHSTNMAVPPALDNSRPSTMGQKSGQNRCIPIQSEAKDRGGQPFLTTPAGQFNPPAAGYPFSWANSAPELSQPLRPFLAQPPPPPPAVAPAPTPAYPNPLPSFSSTFSPPAPPQHLPLPPPPPSSSSSTIPPSTPPPRFPTIPSAPPPPSDSPSAFPCGGCGHSFKKRSGLTRHWKCAKGKMCLQGMPREERKENDGEKEVKEEEGDGGGE